MCQLLALVLLPLPWYCLHTPFPLQDILLSRNFDVIQLPIHTPSPVQHSSHSQLWLFYNLSPQVIILYPLPRSLFYSLSPGVYSASTQLAGPYPTLFPTAGFPNPHTEVEKF
jgi:hypothetical protein